MKRRLVLGGTGMVGGPVARRLRADGFEVRLLARDPEKARAMLGNSFEIVAGDVTGLGSLERGLVGCEGVHIRFFVHGPEAMTMKGTLERYCRAFHPQVESVSVMPVEAARAAAKSTGHQMLGFFAELMAYFDQVGEMGDPADANRLLGAPAKTLNAWIEQSKVRTV